MKFKHLLGTVMCVATLLSYHLSVVAQDSRVIYTQEESELGTPLVAPPRVDNIFLRLGPDVDYISLPAFTGGKGKLTYTFSSTPSLPQGVAFDARGRRISFIDLNGNQNSPAKSYTYTATDEDGVYASATVSITVIDAYPIATTIPELRFVMNRPIEPVTLPTFETTSDDNPALSYSISGLPVGLEFNAGTRRLSGVPRYFRTANIWYEATDGVDIVRTPLIIEAEVNTRPVAPTQTQALTFNVGGSSQSRTLLPFTGGNGDLTYTLTRNLPTGLSFNAETRVISGVVPDNVGDDSVIADRYTYTATDEDGDTTSATYTLALNDAVPTFGSSTIANIVATQNSPISSVTLPSATLGTGSKTYLLSPTVPAGLSFNPSSRVLSGTPTGVTPTTSYTYIAKDTVGDITSLTFTITVKAPNSRPVAPTQPQSLTFTVSPSTQSIALEAFTGGDGVLTYAMASTPSLPSWITFDPSRLLITVGSDTALDQNLPRRTYTYTATDEDSDTTSATFTLRVYDIMLSFGNSSIADVVATQNSPISSVTLPAATPNPVNTYYSVSPSLPRGLSFESYYRRLSGTPAVASPTTTYTYTARYSSGDSASLTFTITVEEEEEPDTSPLAPAQAQSYTFTVGASWQSIVLEAFTGGNGTLTYAMASTPSLPDWITFDPSSREITIGHDRAGDNSVITTSYTYTATDEDGDSASANFTLTVNDIVPYFGDSSIADIVLTQNSRVTEIRLPAATSSFVERIYTSYFLSPTLPAGLNFSSYYRRISGTPTVVTPTTTYTYTAYIGDDSASLTFTITVEEEPDAPPIAPTQAQDLIFTAGVPVESGNTLRAFTGGSGELTYALATTPRLPPGLSFNGNTLMLEGTIPDNAGDDSIGLVRYTYTATDENGLSSSATFTICVIDYVASFDGRYIANITATLDSPIRSVTLPYAWSNSLYAGAEFTYPVLDTQRRSYFDYSLSPALPEGLRFNPNYRVLSGTPAVASSTTTYTYTATEAASHGGGDTASLTFTITVEEPDAPPIAPTQAQDLIFTAGVPVESGNTLRAFTGGSGELTYALATTPRLPPGLSFNGNTLMLEGTIPDNAGDDSIGLVRYTYTATDENGLSSSATFTICVFDNLASFEGRSIANISATLDSPIASVTLPYAYSYTLYDGTQFTSPVSDTQRHSYFDYSLSPSLPQGLTFNPSSRVLSGTPSVASLTATCWEGDALGWCSGTPTVGSPTTTYTYTATEAASHGGRLGVGDSASLTFTITVEEEVEADMMPMPPTGTQRFAFSVGSYSQSRTLREFTGGDAPLTYALASTPSLPDWITFNPSTRRITVGPDSAVDQNLPATTYTYTATDADGDTASTTFTLTTLDRVPSFGYSTIADIVATVNSPIIGRGPNGIRLPYSSDASRPQTFSLSPSLPQGLTFDNHILSGTPTRTHPTTTYTYTVTDEDGDSASLTFTITVEADSPRVTPNQRPPSGQNLILVAGKQPTSSSRTLDAFRGGTGTLTYTLTPTPSLPSGLTFNARTRMIEGVIPDTAGDDSAELITYTYTATDEDGNSASTNFHISVYDYLASFDERTIANITATQNSPIRSVVLPYAFSRLHSADGFSYRTGDNQFLSMFEYSLSPSLPAGLTFNAENHILYGTPEVGSSTTTYTYTATEAIRNGGGDSASLTFTITVEEGLDSLPVAPVVSNFVFSPGQVVNHVLPPFTGGDGPLTYSLTEDTEAVTYLVGGLTYDPATRTISGTISGTPQDDSIAAIAYTYTATDSDAIDPDTASVDFTIEIVDDMPDFRSSALVDLTLLQNLQNSGIVSQMLPTATSGTGKLTYSLTPALPSGLEFIETDRLIPGIEPERVLTGIPVVASPTTTYTYAATDEDGDSAEIDFSITVIEDLQPIAPTGTVAYTFAVGQVVSTTLPAFTGGNGVLSYSLTPVLPTGLAFNPSSREITGTSFNQSLLTEYTYTAVDEDGDSTSIAITVSVVPVAVELPGDIDTVVDTVPIAPPVLAFKFVPGQSVRETLPPFTSGNGALTYKLKATPALPSGLTFNANNRVLSGTLSANTAGDDSVPTTTYSYTATDEDGDSASASFSIEVLDLQLTAPVVSDFTFTLDLALTPITLPVFTSTLSTHLTYTLAPLPKGLTFTPATRVLAGTPVEEGKTTLTYTATDISGVSSVVTFIIDVMDVPPLEVATTNTLPSLGANIAQVATQAVSSRVELALDGQSQGLDVRTSEGQQFKLNAQNSGLSSNSLARFGVWYSSSDDTLNSTGSALSWNGTTESTNVGFDVGFDVSSKASIVIGVMQNASSTSAIYNSGGDSGKLDIDLDSTTFYVGFGYDWLDVWFANGNADSILSDSVRDGFIPTSFAYQTIGLTAAFDFTDGFEIGAKVESLNSALSLSSREALNYSGLESASSQFRTAFFVNYKLDLGREGNAQLIPKFEMGYRGLSQSTSAQGSAPAAGTAAETSFGLDYHNRLLNLTVGFDVRSFEVQDYTSESMQWHIRWESGAYDRGLSLQLKPHSIAESLGGVEALYTSDYSQYQSLLARQYGGDTQATNDDGLDFEMGYGIIAKAGTFTPFVKATNIGTPRGIDSGRRTEEVGLRYEASTGLDLGLKMEQAFRPESSSSSMARESIVTFTTRYNF